MIDKSAAEKRPSKSPLRKRTAGGNREHSCGHAPSSRQPARREKAVAKTVPAQPVHAGRRAGRCRAKYRPAGRGRHRPGASRRQRSGACGDRAPARQRRCAPRAGNRASAGSAPRRRRAPVAPPSSWPRRRFSRCRRRSWSPRLRPRHSMPRPEPSYPATARVDDPRRPTPPADIPDPRPLDLRAEAADRPRRTHHRCRRRAVGGEIDVSRGVAEKLTG